MPSIVVPACDAPTLVPDQFQEGGFNTAYIHPPTYYFLTSVLSAPGRFLDLEPVTAGRIAGGAWLCLGLLLTWIVGRRLRIDDVALCGTLLLIGVMPSVIYSSSVINPDAASLPVGAAALLLTLEAERRAWLVAMGSVGWSRDGRGRLQDAEHHRDRVPEPVPAAARLAVLFRQTEPRRSRRGGRPRAPRRCWAWRSSWGQWHCWP